MNLAIIFHFLWYLVPTLFHKIKGEDSISEFEDHLIVPHLLPSLPKEICSVIYKPGVIILTAKSYFPYQIQGIPDITWSHKLDTFYTVIILGAFHKRIEYASTISPELNNNTIDLWQKPPEFWWHQWVKVNIFESDLSSSGRVVQPFLESGMPQPNGTHDIIYAFAVYEQNDELEFKTEDANSSPRTLLQKYFTPIANFENNFNGSVFLAGNFFYASPMQIVLDTSVVRRIRWKD